jgi:hypothetical protein
MTVERALTVIAASVLIAIGGCSSSGDGTAGGGLDAGGNAGGGAAGSAGTGAAGNAGGAGGTCVGLDATACAARADCFYITHLLACPGTQCPYVFDRCADDGCNPACTAGNVCVSNQTVGGRVIEPNDAGICPTGMHPVPSGGTGPRHCEANPTYTCAPRPAACTGTLSCSCAGVLCESGHACRGTTQAQVSCVEAVP